MAKEKSSEVRIIEERVELMVDPASSKITQNPTKRTAFFLKPSLNPNALPPKLPKIQSFSSSSKPNVVFNCSSIPLKGWETWVENLRVTHEPTWRNAGIFDAIKCSTYRIARVNDLFFSLVQRWCPETNTFVFPWGEATITLEDVYVLGGFSPLGVSVSSSSSSLGKDVEEVQKKLMKSYGKLSKNGRNLSQLRWQEHFMGCGNPLENAGFLALWLARHVFAGKSTTTVPQAVLSMAARLSCGAKLAFGPMILASIYRDLTLLKRKIVGSVSDRSLRLTSPLYLVQVWAWERFPSLGPVPRMINCGEIRLARWVSHGRKLSDDTDDMEMCLDSSRETFRWRPYTMSLDNWSLPRFYVDAGKRVGVDSHKDWKLFSRCLMVSQLVGLNCVEGYNPHRVALQFGFDQDIPESVDRSKDSSKLGWLVYKKNLRGLELYIPPRLHEGDVTRRYFNWWRAGSHSEEQARVGCKRKKRTRKRAKKLSKICDTSNEFDAIDVSGNARENLTDKSPPKEEGSSRSVLQVCNRTRMTCVFHMKVGSISQEDTSTEEDEVMTINRSLGENGYYSDHLYFHNDGSNQFEAEDIGGSVRQTPIEKFLPSVEVSSRNVFQIGNNFGINSQEDPSTEEDEVDEVRYINHSMSECSNNSDHSSTRNEVEENEINILCSKLEETELNTPCEEAVCSDFAAKHQNLAVRRERGSKNSEVNARHQNEEHNVVEHHIKMEVNTLDSQLAEDKLAVTLCEENDCTIQADIPAVSIVGSDFAARHHNLATEVEKSRALSSLMRPEGVSKHSEVNDIEKNKEHKVVEHHVKMEVQASGSLLRANIPAGGQLAVSNVDNPFAALCAQYELRINRLEKKVSTFLGTKSKPCIRINRINRINRLEDS